MNKKCLGIVTILSTMVLAACGPTTSGPTSQVPPSDPTSDPTSTGPSFVAPEHISLIGTIGSTSWDTDFDLATSDEGHSWSISDFVMNEGEEWKIRKNYEWGTAGVDNWGYEALTSDAAALFADKGGNIQVTTSGKYTITFDAETFAIGATLTEEMYSMAIEAETSYVYMTKTLQLGVSFTKADVADEIEWTVSDDTIATVAADGLLTPVAPGTVTVTATNKTNTNVKAVSVEIEVRDVVVNVDGIDSYTNIDGIYQENPVVEIKQNSGSGYPEGETFSQVEFNVEASERYYAKARLSLDPASKWVWSRMGLVNKKPGESFSRGLYYSSADNNNKMILTENPNGWGATTDRNQYWNFLGEHDLTNSVVELLRDGNNFYYWINDQLLVSESINDVFISTQTVPAISFVDANGRATEMYATTDETVINEQLKRVPSNGYGFWGSYEENVVVDNAAGTIEFKNNNNQWPFDNVKDNAAFAIGDMGHLPANQNSKYEFDVTFKDFGTDPDSAYVALSFKPYNNPNDGIRTLMVNKFRNGVNGWGWNGGCSNALNESTDFETSIPLDEAVHVTITRDITRGYVQNVRGVEKVWGWDDVNTQFIPFFVAYRCNAIISNITFTIL